VSACDRDIVNVRTTWSSGSVKTTQTPVQQLFIEWLRDGA